MFMYHWTSQNGILQIYLWNVQTTLQMQGLSTIKILNPLTHDHPTRSDNSGECII